MAYNEQDQAQVQVQVVNRARKPNIPVWQRYPVYEATHTWWIPTHLGLVYSSPLPVRRTLESRWLNNAKAQSVLGSRTVCWFKYVDTANKVIVLDSSMAHIAGMAKTKNIRLTNTLRGALIDKALGVKPYWVKFVFKNGISLEAVCL